MTDRPRWLWITAEVAVPPTTGRLVYSTGLIGGLADAGVQMTVVGLGRSAGSDDDGVQWHLIDEPRRPGWRSLVSTMPNLASACATRGLRSSVADLLDRRWDAVVVDHLQTAWAVGSAARRGEPVVFVTHNHESSVRRKVAAEEGSPLRRMLLTLDAAKAARLESRAVASADLVTAITESDRAAFERDLPGVSLVVLPPAWTGPEPDSAPAMSSRARQVGVLGSFDWHVKQANLLAFVDAAAGPFREAGIRLVVGGSAPERFRREVMSRHRWVEFLGWIDQPSDVLHASRIGLVAEPLGGGFKLKTLDYAMHEVVIAAVDGSVEGLPLESGTDYLVGADHASLASVIVDWIDRPGALAAMAASSLAACRSQATWSSRGAELVDSVERLRA